ncbi:MAG: MBL fold metallo-hydrolase [Acidobacteriota bacterium]|nr:MBL fold metallo-hydrolase [Acidobacteriota bacterium]
MRMTVLASGSKGNSTLIASSRTRILLDAGLSCRELLRRMASAGEDPAALSAILITHEHQDHVAGLATLARRLSIPVFFTEPTHRAWVRSLTPRTTLTYAQWLAKVQAEKAAAAASLSSAPPAATSSSPESETTDLCAEAEASDTAKADPAQLPDVQYFRAGEDFQIGDLHITPFTIPHDAADPCGFVVHCPSEGIRMAVATDLGYMPPNVKAALRGADVLLLESNHDLEMLKDGPYPWSVKQRVLSRVGHLSNHATADFLARDYDGGAHTIVLGHLSEQNNAPALALLAARQALDRHPTLLGNHLILAEQASPLAPITL